MRFYTNLNIWVPQDAQILSQMSLTKTQYYEPGKNYDYTYTTFCKPSFSTKLDISHLLLTH